MKYRGLRLVEMAASAAIADNELVENLTSSLMPLDSGSPAVNEAGKISKADYGVEGCVELEVLAPMPVIFGQSVLTCVIGPADVGMMRADYDLTGCRDLHFDMKAVVIEDGLGRSAFAADFRRQAANTVRSFDIDVAKGWSDVGSIHGALGMSLCAVCLDGEVMMAASAHGDDWLVDLGLYASSVLTNVSYEALKDSGLWT